MDKNKPIFSQDDLATILAVNRHILENEGINTFLQEKCPITAYMGFLLLGEESHIKYLMNEYNIMAVEIAEQEMAESDYDFVEATAHIMEHFMKLFDWMKDHTPKDIKHAYDAQQFDNPTKISLALWGTRNTGFKYVSGKDLLKNPPMS